VTNATTNHLLALGAKERASVCEVCDGGGKLDVFSNTWSEESPDHPSALCDS
jgi:hypothetical protein